MTKEIDIKIPDLGDFDSVEVIDVLVNAGDQVNVDDPLITLESDKASMDIPATAAGTIKNMSVSVGDSVKQGDVIGLLEASETASSGAAEPVAETSAEAPSESSTAMTVTVPDIGDFDSVEVIDVIIKAGDQVNVEDPLITVESDKASMDIPSPVVGTVLKVLVNNGDSVSKDSPVAELQVSAQAAAPAPSTKPAPAVNKAVEAAPAPPPPVAPPPRRAAPLAPINESSFKKAHASPSVRKFARELGADLGQIRGSGNKGRILKDDVKAFVKQILTGGAVTGGLGLEVAPTPEVDFASFGEVETQALSKINKLTGKNLHSSWVRIPHVTQFDEADITEMEAHRKQMSAEYKEKGIKITPIAFLIKAVIEALKEFPRFNSSLDSSGEQLILKKYFHIGVAVDTPQGLMVPVIRDADQSDIVELAQKIVDVAQRARDKKLRPDDMKGGCFTISSLGGVGGTAFTPIVNPPEVAILGLSRSSIKPVYQNNEFVPRLMLPMSLSYDHRVIDGVQAAKFTTFLAEVMADYTRLLSSTDTTTS